MFLPICPKRFTIMTLLFTLTIVTFYQCVPTRFLPKRPVPPFIRTAGRGARATWSWPRSRTPASTSSLSPSWTRWPRGAGGSTRGSGGRTSRRKVRRPQVFFIASCCYCCSCRGVLLGLLGQGAADLHQLARAGREARME